MNGGKKIEVSTVDYSYAIPHVPGCANVVVEFWTISATDTISKGSLVEYFTGETLFLSRMYRVTVIDRRVIPR